MLKLALQSIRYYKKQSIAVLTGVILSVALLTGISSLIYSGQQSNMKNCMEIYGSWNYCFLGDEEAAEQIAGKQDAGYLVERYGILKIADLLQDEMVSLQYADASYLEMMGQPVLEGSYPQKANEIAMSRFTLDNLNSSAKVGETVTLAGTDYQLCGIVKDPWARDTNVLTAFISRNAVGEKADSFIYLKMEPSIKLYKQEHALLKEKAVPEKMKENRNLNAYFGEENPKMFFKVLYSIFFERDLDPYVKNYNFTYIVLTANDLLNLSFNGAVFFLGLFSLFVIYSLFQIGIEKRMSVYGILQALGIGKGNQFLFILSELWSLLLVGFPVGTLFGNGAAYLLYNRFNTVFMDMDVVRPAAQHGGSETKYYMDAARLTAQGFQVSRTAVVFGILFLMAASAWIAWRLTVRTEKLTVMQLIRQAPDEKKRESRKVYSRRRRYIPDVLNRKFMLIRIRSFFSILVSLSLGGAVFLCISFVLVNAKESSRMQLASEDGLGNDLKVYESTQNLKETISQDKIEELKRIPGIQEVYAVKSYICELLREPDEILWKHYFESVNKNFGGPYDGIRTIRKDGRYVFKSNMLGYDELMLEQLTPYLLDGDINIERMKQKNEIVVVDRMDGQGNYGGFSLRAGDKITLRTPKKIEGTIQDFKFLGSCQEEEYTIGAVVKRAFMRDSCLYEDPECADGYTFYVIMTQEQMQQNFGVEGYRVAGLETEEDADTQAVSNAVKQAVDGLEHVLFQDYTGSIMRQNEYLTQKAFFYYGIAVLLFIVSLFHIINTMNHIILSRKHEYGILRAMGITDYNLMRMMLRQGLAYGILSSLVMIVLYVLSQEAAVYLMRISKLLCVSLQISPWIIVLTAAVDILVGLCAVMIPAYAIIREEMVLQINLS